MLSLWEECKRVYDGMPLWREEGRKRSPGTCDDVVLRRDGEGGERLRVEVSVHATVHVQEGDSDEVRARGLPGTAWHRTAWHGTVVKYEDERREEKRHSVACRALQQLSSEPDAGRHSR